jgi:hypothetical protein
MRKRLIAAIPRVLPVDRDWLALDHIAVIEITSEDGAHLIESALRLGEERGWRAAGPITSLLARLRSREVSTAISNLILSAMPWLGADSAAEVCGWEVTVYVKVVCEGSLFMCLRTFCGAQHSRDEAWHNYFPAASDHPSGIVRILRTHVLSQRFSLCLMYPLHQYPETSAVSESGSLC